MTIKMPLKQKYLVFKPAGCGKCGAQNSAKKKLSIAAALYASWKARSK